MRTGATVAALAVLFAAGLSRAQGDLPVRHRGPPADYEQAIDQGYEPRPEDEPAGSVAGGLLALGPGFVAHGIGHAYIGDTSTAVGLFLAELAGAALFVSGVLLDDATVGSGDTGAPRKILVHAGAALFVGSYVADVVGTFKGAEPFDANTSRVDETQLRVGYTFNEDPVSPFRHIFGFDLSIDMGRVYSVPSFELDVQNAYRLYALDLGVRVLRGRDPRNHLALGAEVRRREQPEFGVASREYEGYLQLRFDVGTLVSSMENLYAVHRTGIGYEQVQIGGSESELPSLLEAADYGAAYIAVGSGVEFNTGRKTTLLLGWAQDPMRYPAPPAHNGGIFEAMVTHAYGREVDVRIHFAVGQGFTAGASVGYGL